MKTWKNDKGEGKLFSFDLMDREDTQIQATMFKETAEKWYDFLQEGKIYLMTNGQVKMANKRYTTIPHDHSITFDLSTHIEEVQENFDQGGSTIVGSRYNFTSF